MAVREAATRQGIDDMFRMITVTPTGFKPAAAAEKRAAQLRGEDDDWAYVVRTERSGWSFIDVYDEDGEFVAVWGD